MVQGSPGDFYSLVEMIRYCIHYNTTQFIIALEFFVIVPDKSVWFLLRRFS